MPHTVRVSSIVVSMGVSSLVSVSHTDARIGVHVGRAADGWACTHSRHTPCHVYMMPLARRMLPLCTVSVCSFENRPLMHLRVLCGQHTRPSPRSSCLGCCSTPPRRRSRWHHMPGRCACTVCNASRQAWCVTCIPAHTHIGPASARELLVHTTSPLPQWQGTPGWHCIIKHCVCDAGWLFGELREMDTGVPC